MCKAFSGVAIFDGQQVILKILAGQDSHTEIRKHHNIPDDYSAAGMKNTPLEYVPTKSLIDFESYKFVFDAERPDWWEEDHTQQAIRQFQSHILGMYKENKLEYSGDLNLRSLTSIPEGVTLSAGGSLDLRSLTSISEGVTVKAKKVYLKQ